MALSSGLPVGRALARIGFEFPTLIELGVRALAVWADLALFGFTSNQASARLLANTRATDGISKHRTSIIEHTSYW